MQIPFRKKVLSSLLCGSAAALSQGTVLAQENEHQLLEEVLVTATRRSLSVTDVPYNITAISGDDLESKNIIDVSELIRTIPGASYFEQGPRSGINNSNLVFRGINAEDALRLAGPFQTAPVVSIYINETPVFANMRMKDIARVEVLRGPQGTLYGSGSLGGTIRYIYNKPDFEEVTVDVSTGVSQTENADGVSYEADAIVNIPLGDTFAIRAYAGVSDSAGFIDQPNLYARDPSGAPSLANGSTDPFGDAENFYSSQPIYRSKDGVNDNRTEAYRVALRWKPNDRLDASLSYQYQEDDSGGVPFSSESTYGKDTLKSALLIEQPAEREVDIIAAELDFEMGFATFTGSISQYQSKGQGVADLTGVTENLSFFPAYYGTSPRPIIEAQSTFDDEGTVYEMRLTSNTKEGDFFDWMGGVYYLDQKIVSSENQFYYGYTDWSTACFIATDSFGPPGPCGFGTFSGIVPGVTLDQSYVVNQDVSFEDLAVFGELTGHITDAWQATIGARWFDQKYKSAYEAGLPFADPVTTKTKTNIDTDDTIFKFNSSYDITEDMMVYFTWSEGFRRGGTNGLPEAFGIPNEPEILAYSSDSTENRELGIKGTLAGRYRYTLTYFNMDWDDIQTNALCTLVAYLCAINAGDANIEGVEFEVVGRPLENVEFTVSYTYQDAVLEELADRIPELVDSGQILFDINEGSVLPGAPKNSLYLGGNFTQHLDNGWDLVYGLNGSYRDEAESTLDVGSVMADDFWIWNFTTAVYMDDLSATFFVNNLSDERGVMAGDNSSTDGGWGPRASSLVSTPRTYGVVLRYSFGG